MTRLEKLMDDCGSDYEFSRKYADTLTEDLEGDKGLISPKQLNQIIAESVQVGTNYARRSSIFIQALEEAFKQGSQRSTTDFEEWYKQKYKNEEN